MKSDDRPGKSGILGKLYVDGEVIYRQGEMGDCMFVVESGQVELLQRKGEQEYCLGVLDAGKFFGFSGLFARHPRSATVRALGSETSVLRLHRSAFMQRAHEDPSFMFNLVEQLIHRNRELEAALVRVGEAPVPMEFQASLKKTGTNA